MKLRTTFFICAFLFFVSTLTSAGAKENSPPNAAHSAATIPESPPPSMDLTRSWGTTWATDGCQMTEPTADGKIYYLSPRGDNNNNALTPEQPAQDLSRLRYQLVPGDVVRLTAGVYVLRSGAFSFNGQSGSPNAPITFEGECNRTLVHGSRLSTTPNRKPAIYIGNSHYITVRNMVVENMTDNGIFAEYASHITIDNVEIRNTWANGVWVNRGSHITVKNVYVHDAVMENRNVARVENYAGISQWHQGIAFARTSHALVHNCRVENVWGEGIDFIGANGNNPDTGIGTAGETHNVARYNYVRNTFSIGLYFDQMHNSVFEGNIVIMDDPAYYRGGLPSNGIAIADEGLINPRQSRNLVIRNNIVVGANAGINYGSYGMGFGLRDAKILNNTVIDSRISLRISAPKHSYTHQNNLIANNIFTSTWPGGIAAIVPAIGGLTFSNNLWHGNSQGRDPLVRKTDILDREPQLKRSLLGGVSSCTDTMTADIECYRPATTSPAVNRGLSIPAYVKYDQSGFLRPQFPTLGALEAKQERSITLLPKSANLR